MAFLKTTGLVVSGTGKAQFFTVQPFYAAQFETKLGFKPFPGTLNLRVSVGVKQKLASAAHIVIEGDAVHGGAKCYRAELGSVACFLIVPDKSQHGEDILEVLAPVNLRHELSLLDNHKVELLVY